MIEFFKRVIGREIRTILGETGEEERARKRKEIGNHCSDIFCIQDPCRDCPNIEWHRRIYGEGAKR